MGVVLLIIGIIIAAVMKAQDLISSAENTNTIKNFFEPWQSAVYDLYDANGTYLADFDRNGEMDNIYIDGTGSHELDDSRKASIVQGLEDLGIDICTSVKTEIPKPSGSAISCARDIFRTYVNSGMYGKVEINLGFHACEVNGITKNCLVFHDIPSDVAKRVDKYFDQIADPQEGNVLFVKDTASLDDGVNSTEYRDYPDPTSGESPTKAKLAIILNF